MGDQKRRFYKEFARFSAIGLEMSLSVAIGLAIGHYLDRYFRTQPWLTILFLLLGAVAGFRSLYFLVKEIDRRERKK